MNMPNRISVNTTSAPGKRQRDSTNPFAEPIRDEMTATGIASSNVRMKDGPSAVHALLHDAVVHSAGRFHCPFTPISRPDLKLVTISTYAGISTMIRKMSSSRYPTKRPTGERRLSAPPRGFLVSAGVVTAPGAGVTTLAVMTSDAPPGG